MTWFSVVYICLRVVCSLLCALAVNGVSYRDSEKVKACLIKHPAIPRGVSCSCASGWHSCAYEQHLDAFCREKVEWPDRNTPFPHPSQKMRCWDDFLQYFLKQQAEAFFDPDGYIKRTCFGRAGFMLLHLHLSAGGGGEAPAPLPALPASPASSGCFWAPDGRCGRQTPRCSKSKFLECTFTHRR